MIPGSDSRVAPLTERFLVWRGLEEWLAEAAEVQLEADRLRARGTQLGAEPHPYRADYELATTEGWVTDRLEVAVHDGDGERRLDLRRGADGGWTANGEALPDLSGALDCDLAFSPLTNAMPILRDGGGPADYEMAWVSLPDLAVRLSLQRYEPIDERTVRYVSRDSDFSAELELDADRLVVRYARLAERV
jgi:uncharacterized protein